MSGTFPPTGPTSLQTILPPYPYQQYSDDQNIQAFNQSATNLFQAYLDWFNNTPLPIYTNAAISGSLLDWVAQGIYGIKRPALTYGGVTGIGLLGSYLQGSIVLGSYSSSGAITAFTVNDDIFKRIITWFFYKGDGQNYCTTWLKRRIMRFLTGANGNAPNIGETYPISVTYSGGGAVVITITYDGVTITQTVATIFQAAVAAGAIDLPFQLSFTVEIA